MNLRRTLTHLDINLGDLCNLRCVACECWLNECPPRIASDRLTRRLDDVLNFVETECPAFQKVMLIGGEPFVHRGLEEWLRSQRFSAVITVYTNLSVGPLQGKWPENVQFLTSLDAADADTYWLIRRGKNFALTQENLLSLGPNLIHVDTTVSRYNLTQLAAIREITRPLSCSHWFLPVDPRLMRYRMLRARDGADLSELERIDRVIGLLKPALLGQSDIAMVEAFFHRNQGDTRMNTLAMFNGIYVSGRRHFHEIPEYGLEVKSGSMPSMSAEACPGLHGYMEIRFSEAGDFVPVLHCDRLREAPLESRVPPFSRFADLVDWDQAMRSRVICDTFCGRTQFLGLDPYKDAFALVSNSIDGKPPTTDATALR